MGLFDLLKKNTVKDKSLIAPTYFERHNDHLKIGELYQKVLLVTELPEMFNFGLFKWALNDIPVNGVKYFYVTKPMTESMSKAITGEIRRKEQQIRKEKDEVIKNRLINEIDNLQIVVADIAASSNRSLDLLTVIIVTATNLQDLKDNTVLVKTRLETNFGFKLFDAYGLQEELFKTVLPFWKKRTLTKDLNYRYRIPLSTRSVATLWPYYYEDVRDPNGLLLGSTAPSGGLFIHNIFFWEDSINRAREIGISAGNMVILGQTGSGKTTVMNKYANYFVREMIRFIWFDPNNQNQRYIANNNGTYVNFGAPNNIINVLELKRVGDGNENSMVDPYDMRLAKYECIRDLKEIVKLYNPNNLREVEKAVNTLDEIVNEVYEDFGITGTSFKGIDKDSYPILEDVLKKIRVKAEMRKSENYGEHDAKLEQLINLDLYISPMCAADGQYFNGHTSFDFNDETTLLYGFGTKLLDNTPRNIKNGVYYLVMRQVASILYDASRKCACIWDEFEKVALDGFTLPMCSDLCRMVRKYHSVMVLGMQEPSDLNIDVMIRDVSVRAYGAAIMNNATYKFIMHLEDKAIKDLSELTYLSDYEYNTIPQLTVGQGIFFRNKHHYFVNVHANRNDIEMMEVR